MLSMTSAALAQVLLDPVAHPKFVNPLPIPARLDVTAGGNYSFEMRETIQSYGLVDAAGLPLLTTVWGYGQPDDVIGALPVTSPGPTLVAMENVPVNIKWMNRLPSHYNYPYGPNPHLLAFDIKNHNAMPTRGGLPAVVHLHGGHTESASDGLPEQWYTQNWREKGPHWMKKRFTYHNDQEAATLWYHDHALGITRLNVYAGMAGFYLLRDQNEMNLTATGVLPGVPYENEIVGPHVHGGWPAVHAGGRRRS
jgi:spore coat protein A